VDTGMAGVQHRSVDHSGGWLPVLRGSHEEEGF
jgi:hypothetical protein